MAVVAEVDRYAMVVKADKQLCNSWNRLLVVSDGRLVKQAFCKQSAVLCPPTRSTGCLVVLRATQSDPPGNQ